MRAKFKSSFLQNRDGTAYFETIYTGDQTRALRFHALAEAPMEQRFPCHANARCGHQYACGVLSAFESADLP